MKLKLALYICLPSFTFLSITNTLKAQTLQTDTAVVNQSAADETYIGFGRQNPRFITSAISTVKGAELRKQFTNSIGNTSAGKLPGFTVNVGGSEPGAASPLLI